MSARRRFTALVSFERPCGALVETRRIHIGADSEAEAADIALGVAVILGAGKTGAGSVDSIRSLEEAPEEAHEHEARTGTYGAALTIEQAIVWALTLGQPGDDDDDDAAHAAAIAAAERSALGEVKS